MLIKHEITAQNACIKYLCVYTQEKNKVCMLTAVNRANTSQHIKQVVLPNNIGEISH